MNWKKYIWAILYGIVLTAFTVYVALDTFVIERVYTEIPQSSPTMTPANLPTKTPEAGLTVTPVAEAAEGNTAPETAPVATPVITPFEEVRTETEYWDETIHVVLNEYREYDTAIYVAEVTLSSPEYLKTALAKGAYGRNLTEKTSEMAEANQAILAINGDYYGARERGYVLRNGVLYRETADGETEDLVIYADGSFGIISEAQVSARSLSEAGAMQVLSFGPALVTEGSISVTEEEEVGLAMASNPRTAIGELGELHYVFVVSDGRTKESAGLTLYELAEFMQTLGVATAYNLDGGGSATMVFQGKVVNQPTTNGRSIKERSVSDIVYIGTGK